MIEIQALVSSAMYGTFKEYNRIQFQKLNMILAVGKEAGFKLGLKMFLNITGGIKIEDPAIDLSVVVAILSSNVNTPIPANLFCC